jgi:hypothetical protein
MLLQRARLENAKRGLPKALPKEDPAAPVLTPEEREISPLQVMLAQVRNTTPDGRLGSDAQVLENLVGSRLPSKQVFRAELGKQAAKSY